VADAFGIERFAAVMGGSLGGILGLAWGTVEPDSLAHCNRWGAAPKPFAQNIAFNEVARSAILSDPDFHGGDYYAHGVKPKRGFWGPGRIGPLPDLAQEG